MLAVLQNQNYPKEEDNNEMLLKKRRCFLSINKTKRWNERERVQTRPEAKIQSV
jgi:hypothetical protein